MGFDAKGEVTKLYEEYNDFVKSMSQDGGKLAIVTFEGEELIVEVTSSGLFVNADQYETFEGLMMERSYQFSKLFHETLLSRIGNYNPN